MEQPDEKKENISKKIFIYNSYLKTSEHTCISARFPDMNLVESFEIFNPSIIPRELSLQSSYGVNMLRFLLHIVAHHVSESDLASGTQNV